MPPADCCLITGAATHTSAIGFSYFSSGLLFFADKIKEAKALFLLGFLCFIDIIQVKYLNNIAEQGHRFFKKTTKPILDFKAFHAANAMLTGIEAADMIRIGQLIDKHLPAHQQFMSLAA
jgi:putative transposase